MDKKIFPKDFLWGASTASHQVEGNNYNQWTVWELANAKELAKKAADPNYVDPARFTPLSATPRWSEIKKHAVDPDNYVSGKGVDHYHLYKTDFDIAKKLNLNSFRFSIEWSRLEPEEGKWNETEFKYYKDYINELSKRGLEPLLNIWHFTLPVWFEQKGGWEKRSNVRYFNRLVSKVAEELLDKVNYVITINEPNVYASHSYFLAKWPPQKHSVLSLLRVYINLISAHKRSYRILKRAKPSLQVGIAAQLGNFQAKRPNSLLDKTLTKTIRYIWNWFFLRRIRKQQDFIGFNYYFTHYYKFRLTIKPIPYNPNSPHNDLGWYMEPEGIYPLLLRIWSRYKKPIIISENGVADAKDDFRQWWLEETVVAMERAISEGVDLRGYLHWSLLDNFEWAEGWWPKFGLVEVDRNHGMKRTVRPSAKWFADKIRSLK